MKHIKLDEIYSRELKGELRTEHQNYVDESLEPDEPILGYKWDHGLNPVVPHLWIITDRRLRWIEEDTYDRIHTGWTDAGYLYDDIDEKVTYVPEKRGNILGGGVQEQVIIKSLKSGRGDYSITYPGKDFADTLQAAVTAYKTKKKAAKPSSTNNATQPRDLAAKLKDLHELHQSGGLTEEQYQQAVKKVLEE